MQAYSPPSRRRGGRDLKKEAAKHPLIGADGVVVSSYRSFIPNDFDNRWLETTTPSAPAKERGHFSYGAATPPSRRRGIRPCPNRFLIWKPLPSRRRGLRFHQPDCTSKVDAWSPSSTLAASLILYFWILPVTVMGNSVTNLMYRGIL